jgi:hypothetical protein
MYQVDATTLINRVRQRSNTEGLSESITDVEILDHINQSFAKWYDLVRGQTWAGQYYRKSFPFQTTPAVFGTTFPIADPPPGQLYQLPSDFLNLISVTCFLNTGIPLIAESFNEEERNKFRWWPIGWWASTPIFYQLWGNNISFIPAPQSVFQVTINYTPVAPRLYNLTDSMDSINGFEEYIVLDSAVKVLIKTGEKEMVGILEGRRQEESERIKLMAPRRDQTAPEKFHERSNLNEMFDWYF